MKKVFVIVFGFIIILAALHFFDNGISIFDQKEFKKSNDIRIAKLKEANRISDSISAAKRETEINAEIKSYGKRGVRFKKLIDEYGYNIGSAIFNRQVQIGMTTSMCLEAWGKPNDINKTTTKNSWNEQWVYNRSYLYFENGILTAVQN